MKYILTNETKEFDGHILHRIRCIELFNPHIPFLKKGGWIESKDNLSQKGNCWVGDEAIVFENARIDENAKVLDYAIVRENANILGDAKVSGIAKIYNNAFIHGNAKIYGEAMIYGNAEIFGKAYISDNALIYDDARICDDAYICGNSQVHDKAFLYGSVLLDENANICGNAMISGYTHITGNAIIKSIRDYFLFKNNWSSGRDFTYTKSNKMWKVGCFYGTGEELIKKAYADCEDTGKHYEAYVRFVEQLEKINQNDEKLVN